jgi:hypothetical protein
MDRGAPAHVPVAVTAPPASAILRTVSRPIFGGFDGHFYSNQTMQWKDGDWTDLAPSTGPGARGRRAVMRWTRRGTSPCCSAASRASTRTTRGRGTGTTGRASFRPCQPNAGYNAAAAFDPFFGAVLLFGGAAGGPDLNELVEWTGTDWVELTTGRTPMGRESHAFVYDEATGLDVLFGGQAGDKLFRGHLGADHGDGSITASDRRNLDTGFSRV